MKYAVLCFLFFLALVMPAAAQSPAYNAPLIADSSTRTIDIHASFTGTTILFFGARNEPGDIVIAIYGPQAELTLRRKDRIAGMWMNVESTRFFNVPLYFAMAATLPLSALPEELRTQLDFSYERFLHATNPNTPETMRLGLARELERKGWVHTQLQPIRFFGETLFRANIAFPDNLPRGHYSADIYLIRDGQLVSMQTIPIVAEKTGIDAWLYDRAQDSPWHYGIGAVLLSLFGGWLGNRLLGSRR